MPFSHSHQYINRSDQTIATETLFSDVVVRFLYTQVREQAPFIFNKLLSSRFSTLLGYFNYDFPLARVNKTAASVLKSFGAPLEELYQPLGQHDSYRKIFERQIKYWKYRPMDDHSNVIVSVADSRLLPGSFRQQDHLSIKGKLFDFKELIGPDQIHWHKIFSQGDFAVFRLTPDQYHYNHTPVSGRVKTIYEINGCYHSCNPGAMVKAVTPYSKNRRVVTIFDTDVPNGSHVGFVAMIEVAALMIGDIVQCYSSRYYDTPRLVTKGLFLKKGAPKSLFKPGSSTTILIFEKNRFTFSPDLIENRLRQDVASRFTTGFDLPMVETDIRVRETIGERI